MKIASAVVLLSKSTPCRTPAEPSHEQFREQGNHHFLRRSFGVRCCASNRLRSRAKPLLMDLEQRSAIKEAWLNRAGTIVAIVWSGAARSGEVAIAVFERHEIQYRERRGDRETSFRIDGSWFRGAQVDRLSLEEAQEIAETSVSAAARERLVSIEEAAQIKSDIEAYFREEHVRLRTKQELLQDTQGKFPEAVPNVYQKHVGMERTAGVQAARNPEPVQPGRP